MARLTDGVLQVLLALLLGLLLVVLLGLVARERIYDPVSHPYVDLVVGATATASVLVLGTGICVSASVGSPAVVGATLLALLGAGATWALVVVRGLLHEATAQRAEPAEVVR